MRALVLAVAACSQGACCRVTHHRYWRFRSLFKRQFFVNVWNSFQVSFGPAFATFALFLVLGKVHPTPANRSQCVAPPPRRSSCHVPLATCCLIQRLAQRGSQPLGGGVFYQRTAGCVHGSAGLHPRPVLPTRAACRVSAHLTCWMDGWAGTLGDVESDACAVTMRRRYTHRLGQMLDGMDELEVVEKHIASTGHAVEDGKEISLDNLTCRTPGPCLHTHTHTHPRIASAPALPPSRTSDRCSAVRLRWRGVALTLVLFAVHLWVAPDGTALFHNFTYTVQPGSSVMVMGASGVGKSSLLRVIGGLWPFDSGRLRRPLTTGHGGCFFLPQRPYITQGTLRQQVVYPLDQGEVGEGADERVKVSVGAACGCGRWMTSCQGHSPQRHAHH